MGIELLLFMGVLVVGMFVMNSFPKTSAKKRQDEQERTMREQMVPGAWVQTYSGFFGRFVDFDGDVVILETPSGEETYWIKAAIRAVNDPPFEAIGEEDGDHTEVEGYELDVTDVDAADIDPSDPESTDSENK